MRYDFLLKEFAALVKSGGGEEANTSLVNYFSDLKLLMNSHSLFHFSEQSNFEEIQHRFINNIFTVWICLEF